MSTTPAIVAPSLADLIPAAELARAARLALDTLVSILGDAKATLNERRIAAMAVLRLALPTGSRRTPGVNESAAAPREPSPPTPLATPAPALSPTPALTRHPKHRPARAHELTALAGGAAAIAPGTPSACVGATAGRFGPVVRSPDVLKPRAA